MSDLEHQLRSYFDETSQPLRVDDVLAADRAVSVVPPSTGWRPVGISRGLVIGVAAAVAVVLIVGLPLLLNWGAGEVATTDPPPSTQAIEQSTIAPPTTSVETAPTDPQAVDPTPPPTSGVEVAPTTVGEMTIEVARSVVPGLGTLVWERLDGDSQTLPESVAAYEDGRYVAQDRAASWESPDGFTWSQVDPPAVWSDFRWVRREGRYAIAADEQRTALFEATDTGWQRVVLDEAAYPVVEGVDLQPNLEMPIESGNVVVLPVSLWGSLGLGDLYGTFEVDCGEPEPCVMEPWLEWDPLSDSFRVTSPEQGMPIAALSVRIDPDVVHLVDDATGASVVTIDAASVLPPDGVAEHLRSFGAVAVGGVWVSADGGEFEWFDTPWGAQGRVLDAPAGGFAAFEFVYDWHASATDRLVSADVWTSTDGRSWESHGAPVFVDPTAEHMIVARVSDRLEATAITGYDSATGEEFYESWTSTDGLAWEPFDSPFGPHSEWHETNFGSVVTSVPRGTYRIWVSTDGNTWHEVVGPPGPHEPRGAGYSAATAVGDLIFVSTGEDAGARTLWVGRFEG